MKTCTRMKFGMKPHMKPGMTPGMKPRKMPSVKPGMKPGLKPHEIMGPLCTDSGAPETPVPESVLEGACSVTASKTFETGLKTLCNQNIEICKRV